MNWDNSALLTDCDKGDVFCLGSALGPAMLDDM